MIASTSDPTRVRRRWFSISLRGLMLLTLILGGLMGWQARGVSLRRRAVAGLKALEKEGLDHLRELTKLKTLGFTRGQLDDKTLDEFKGAMPGITVLFTPSFNVSR